MKNEMVDPSRRQFLTKAGASTAALFMSQSLVSESHATEPSSQTPAATSGSLTLDKSDTAVVIIDPQNDVLSETGLAWPLVHESLKENNTIPNIERIFKAAKSFGFEVFISPTTSTQWTKDGNSMAPSRQMRRQRVSSLEKAS